MKYITIKILVLLMVNQTICFSQLQTFEIKYGDRNYFNYILAKEETNIGEYQLKDNLIKGIYFVIATNECGKDTLMVAKFIENSIKDGVWIEWEQKICIENVDEDGAKSSWNFFDEKEKQNIIVYKSNTIIKTITFHFLSNQPHIEHTYPENSINQSEWTNEKVWNEKGNLRWEKFLDEHGKMNHIEYYEDSNIRSVGELVSNGVFDKEWKYYYRNGILMAKGKYENLGDSTVRYYTGLRIPIGEWLYWDERGELIAEVMFSNGEIIRIDKKQDKKIPFPENIE